MEFNNQVNELNVFAALDTPGTYVVTEAGVMCAEATDGQSDSPLLQLRLGDTIEIKEGQKWGVFFHNAKSYLANFGHVNTKAKVRVAD